MALGLRRRYVRMAAYAIAALSLFLLALQMRHWYFMRSYGKFVPAIEKSLESAFAGDVTILYASLDNKTKAAVSEEQLAAFFDKIRRQSSGLGMGKFERVRTVDIQAGGVTVYLQYSAAPDRRDYLVVEGIWNRSGLPIENIIYVWEGGFPEALHGQ